MTMEQISITANSQNCPSSENKDIAKIIISSDKPSCTFQLYDYANSTLLDTKYNLHAQSKTFEWEFEKKQCKKIQVNNGGTKGTYVTIYYY